MNAKSDVHRANPLDTVKLALAALLLLGGIVFYYWFASGANQLSFGVRVAGVVVSVLLALGVAYLTDLGRRTWFFLKDSRMEVRKVVWPTRQETVQTTIAVLAMVILLGIFMWLLDFLLFWALNPLTGQGG